jgi:serine/threonine-protein kinase
MGTLKYMAPERFQQGFSSSIASDVFSLGMIYLEMLTGYLPFQKDTDPVLSLRSGQYLKSANALLNNAKVPKSICEIIRLLIAFRAQDRPSNYNVLRDHLIRAYRKSHGFFSIFT